MAILCMHAMKNTMFREIVNTKKYSCLVEGSSQNKENIDQANIVCWENTNKMLSQGWNGIKTGITPNAGPCLSASVLREINGKEY